MMTAAWVMMVAGSVDDRLVQVVVLLYTWPRFRPLRQSFVLRTDPSVGPDPPHYSHPTMKKRKT